jgi:predicted transcriptional regulator
MWPPTPDIARQTPPPLHELEEEVMEEIWRRQEVSVREVMEALNGRTPKDRA